MILDSERISEGSNEAAYALLALDANKEEVPEESRWNRGYAGGGALILPGR